MAARYIGVVLRARRKELMLSQAEVGEMLNVSATTISMIEKGEQEIPFQKIEHYLVAYGLSSACYDVIVKLEYPSKWDDIVAMEDHMGKNGKALDNKVELMINSGQFK